MRETRSPIAEGESRGEYEKQFIEASSKDLQQRWVSG